MSYYLLFPSFFLLVRTRTHWVRMRLLMCFCLLLICLLWKEET